MRYARSIPELWIPLVMMAIVGTLAFNFNTVLPLFVTRDLGGTEVMFTVLLGVVSAGSLAGACRGPAPSACNRSLSARWLSPSPPPSACSPSHPAWRSPPPWDRHGRGQHRLHDRLDGHRADPLGSPDAGRVLALQSMVFLGSTPMGGPIVGVISQRFGARYGVAVGAVAAIGAGVFGLLTVRKAVRRRAAG